MTPSKKKPALYTSDNRGEVTFPLNVEDITGSYHYRIMVNYPVSDYYHFSRICEV